MPLTLEEREIAAARADTWPGGKSWLLEPGRFISSIEAARILHHHPHRWREG